MKKHIERRSRNRRSEDRREDDRRKGDRRQAERSPQPGGRRKSDPPIGYSSQFEALEMQVLGLCADCAGSRLESGVRTEPETMDLMIFCQGAQRFVPVRTKIASTSDCAFFSAVDDISAIPGHGLSRRLRNGIAINKKK